MAFVSFELNWHEFLVCQVFTEDSHSRNTYSHTFVSKNNIINRLIEKETRKRFRSSFHNDCSDSSNEFFSIFSLPRFQIDGGICSSSCSRKKRNWKVEFSLEKNYSDSSPFPFPYFTVQPRPLAIISAG